MNSGSETISLPLRNGWRWRLNDWRERGAASRVLSGSIVMLVGSVLVAAINFGFNVSMARLLGPSLFAQVAAVVTLLMLASAVSLSFQMVCAKFVARNESTFGKLAVFHGLRKRAWIVGIAIAIGLTLAQKPVAAYLQMPNSWVLAVFALGMAFYTPLGVKRGNMQGLCAFGALSRNYILEAGSKLACAILLVELGYGVMGAVGAISASILAAVLIRSPKAQDDAGSKTLVPASFREGMQAIVFFVGQVVINNIDIILVKHFFASELAGLYAAVALVGRVLYFAAWSIVSAMFPISAAAKDDQNKVHVLLLPFMIVLLMSLAFVVVLALFPGFIIHLILGEGFRSAEPLLSLYAVATGLYALAVVLMTYEMSRKIANTGWVQLIFSGALVLLIYMLHSSLRQVIVVQIVLMLLMLLVVSLPFLRSIRSLRWKEVA
ncbi:MAG TPA: oligosaccharide flippase family protein [Terriglobales bacterium]|nr:oligosaccharide flippase family protein [Terriglobales bacterium]